MAKKPKRYSNLYVKRRLVKLEIDIFAIISNGLLHHTPKKKTLDMIKKEILSLTVQINLNQVEINHVWYRAYEDYQRISKQTFGSLRRIERKFGKEEDYEKSLSQRQEVIYNSIRAKILDNSLIKEANKVMYNYEHRMKHDELYGNGGLLENSESPFFLCSSHPNPAKDHAEWEGRMYYDEDWEAKGEYSEDEKDAIRAYIQNHKLRTVQWVTGAPVYLIVRPNCKHYFVNIPLNEALKASARALLKKHKLYMPDEEPASREVLTYREYYNRLKVEEALDKLVPNDQLKKDLQKDKKLLDKWKKKL